jgi:hypothetical protein
MKRHLAKLIAVAAFCLLGTGQVWAGCYSYTDAYGNTSISCDDGTTGNLYTDPYGNTSGTIGGRNFNIYSDPYGNTSGSVGGSSVNCYTDAYGNTTCN